MLLSALLYFTTFIAFIGAYEEPKLDQFFVDFKKLIKSSDKFNAKAIGDWALLKGCEIVNRMHNTPRHWHLLERSVELFQMGQIATNICRNSNDGQNANDIAFGNLLQTISLNGQRILAQIKAKEGGNTSAGGQNVKRNNELFKFGKYFKSFLAEMPEGQWKSELMALVKSKGQTSTSDLFALLLNKLDDKNEWTDNILGKIFHESEIHRRVRRYDPDLHKLYLARLQHNQDKMALNVRVDDDDDDDDDIHFYEPDIAPRLAEQDDDMTFYEQDIDPRHDERSDKFSVFPPKIIVFLFSIGLAAANLALIAISMLLLGFYLEMIR